MRNSKFKSAMTTTLLVVGFALVMKYNSTESFQSALGFLFNPDAKYALPVFWQDNRMLITGVLVAVLIAFYRPTWNQFRNLVLIYRDSPESSGKPSLFPRQASYLLRQDKPLCLTTWLMEMCGRDAIHLRYQKKGEFPWHISPGPGRQVSTADQALLDALFKENDEIRLQPALSDPHPLVRPVADRIFQALTSENSHYLEAKQGSLPAWVMFLALMAELPFHMAGLAPQTLPMTLPATLFSAALFALLAYVVGHELPTLFSGPRVIGYIKLGAATLFTIFGHWMMYSNSHSPAYLTTALFPGLVLATGVLVFNMPRMTGNRSVIQSIVGYRKHLSQFDRPTREDDLSWTLGLGVHADLRAENFRYGEPKAPGWLESDETDVPSLMKMLHQTLGTNVSKAVYGEMKSDHTLGSRSERSRF